MSRIAREKYNASFFHIMVQGINKEYIFDNEKYKEYYRNLLSSEVKKYDIHIIAYCIMSNHVHILVQTDTIEEMSKFMHSVNTAYAKFYNYKKQRVGYVFRERYKSEPIDTIRYLAKCINYIHLNPVKAKIVDQCAKYEFSSYKNYMKNDGFINLEILKDKLGKDYLQVLKCFSRNVNLFIEDGPVDMDSLIGEFLENRNLKLYEILENIEELSNLLKKLKNKKEITYDILMNKFSIGRNMLANLIKLKHR